jgi:hypothetical protein
MSASGAGPPGPENVAPRLDTEATHKVDDDDIRPIVRSKTPGKADIRRLRQEYQLLCRMQAPIERAFWRLEQRKGRLADRLANEGIAPFCRPASGRKRLRRQPLTPKGDTSCR